MCSGTQIEQICTGTRVPQVASSNYVYIFACIYYIRYIYNDYYYKIPMSDIVSISLAILDVISSSNDTHNYNY